MALCPFADILLISTNIGGNMVTPQRGFAPHTQVGDGSLFTMFNNPTRKASTHFWVSKTGHLEQYVDTARVAWAHGPGNPYFWSSEFEGMDDEPYTSAQIDKGGELIAWLHGLSPFPLVVNRAGLAGQGITPHRDLMATSCPGDTRLAQYPELILATLRHIDGNQGDDLPLTEADIANIWGYMTGGPNGKPPQKMADLGWYTHDDLAALTAKVDALAAEIATIKTASTGGAAVGDVQVSGTLHLES